MPSDIETISREIAKSGSLDGYSLWRALKDINNQIFVLEGDKSPVPIELVRLRRIIIKARAFRRNCIPGRAAAGALKAPMKTRIAADDFDAFDFVDHYRALGGRREAVDMGGTIETCQWDEDTPEAQQFWVEQSGRLSSRQRVEIARCLLERGRY